MLILQEQTISPAEKLEEMVDKSFLVECARGPGYLRDLLLRYMRVWVLYVEALLDICA